MLDPALLLPADEFKQKVSDLIALLEASRPAPGVAKVRVPGRGSVAKRNKAMARGVIEVDEAVYKTLVSLRNGPLNARQQNNSSGR